MKNFVVFFAIFIGIQGDKIPNFDSPELLDITKIVLNDVQKVIAEFPTNKSMYLSNYKQFAKNVNYSACQETEESEEDFDYVQKPDSEQSNVNLINECAGILQSGTKSVERLFNENVKRIMNELFAQIDNDISTFSTELEEIDKCLKNYTIKSEACEEEEVANKTCDLLVIVGEKLQVHLDEIYEHLADLDFVSRFLGPLADGARAEAQSSFDKTLSLIQDCEKKQQSQVIPSLSETDKQM